MTTIREIAEGIVSLPALSDAEIEKAIKARLAEDDEPEAGPDDEMVMDQFNKAIKNIGREA